jgi:hypothetical protein
MENVRSRAEHGLPERVADDCNLFAALLVVTAQDCATEFGSGLEGLKEIPIHSRRAHPLRHALRCEAEDGQIEGGHILKRVTLFLQVVEVSVGGAEESIS